MGQNRQLTLTPAMDDFIHVIGRKMGCQSFSRMMRTNKHVSEVLFKVKKGPKVHVDVLKQNDTGWDIVYGPKFRIGPTVTRKSVALNDISHHTTCFRFAVERIVFRKDASNPKAPFTSDFVKAFIKFAKENAIMVPIYTNIHEIVKADFDDGGIMVRKILEGLFVKTVTTTDKQIVYRDHLCPQMLPSSITTIIITNSNYARNELLGMKAKSFMIGFKDLRPRGITEFLIEWKCGRRHIEDGHFLKTEEAFQKAVVTYLKPSLLYTKSLHSQSVLAPLPVEQLPKFVSDSEYYVLLRPSNLNQKLVVILEKTSIMVMRADDPIRFFEKYLSSDQFRMLSE